ncbi:MAG: hypothetical protein JWM11_2408 [Planctomycetaceae bacterium]|nr:hypothetical protein [Planctomycetaceae bacterium]
MSRGRFNLTASAICWAAILVCPVRPIAALQDANQIPADAQPNVDEAKLRGSLSKEIRQNKELRGSWAKVIVEAEKGLRVDLVIDADDKLGSQQDKLLRERVREYAGAKFSAFGPTLKLPVQALLAKIGTEARKDPLLTGVQVRDATFNSSRNAEGKLSLRLNGSLQNRDQLEILRKLCNEKWWPEVAGAPLAASTVIDTAPPANSTGGDDGLVVPPKTPGAAPPQESHLRSQLLKAIQKNPELKGSWALVKAEREGELQKSLQVILIVDSDSSIGSKQETELRNLVRQFDNSNTVLIGTKPEKLPVTALLKKIQIQTEDNPHLLGIRVHEISFSNRNATGQSSPKPATAKATTTGAGVPAKEPADSQDQSDDKIKLYLKLTGTALNTAQVQILIALCNDKWWPEIRNADQGSSKKVNLTIDAIILRDTSNNSDGMVLHAPAKETAAGNFQVGMDAFLKQDYEKSLTSFTLASQEDPNRMDFKYWRIATLIALKKHDRAQEIVNRLAPSGNQVNPYRTSEVQRSLERLNGSIRTPIRQELELMVRQAVHMP